MYRTARARSWGTTDEEKVQLEYNARNQITLWGPTGQINDYASKEWSGLVSSYHKARWQLFVSSIVAAVKANTTLDTATYNSDLLTVEQKWNMLQTDTFPVTPTGDTVGVYIYIYIYMLVCVSVIV